MAKRRHCLPAKRLIDVRHFCSQEEEEGGDERPRSNT